MAHLQVLDTTLNGSQMGTVPDDLAQNPDVYLGETLYSRRLIDKILGAFNQAYATGEFDVAQLLRDALGQAVDNSETVGGERCQHPALTQAEAWVRYVNARNAYKATVDPLSDSDADAIRVALDQMKLAYQRWCTA